MILPIGISVQFVVNQDKVVFEVSISGLVAGSIFAGTAAKTISVDPNHRTFQTQISIILGMT